MRTPHTAQLANGYTMSSPYTAKTFVALGKLGAPSLCSQTYQPNWLGIKQDIIPTLLNRQSHKPTGGPTG